MPELGLTKNQIISELARSPHGNLQEYVPTAQHAALQEPEFLAHLISWNKINGQIRDSQIALPVVTLGIPGYPAEFYDNSLAHIALLGPREMERAFRFNAELKYPTQRLRNLIKRYLANLESDKRDWNRVAVQHRQTLKTLYALSRAKRPDWVGKILFEQEYEHGSVFAEIAALKGMPAADAATTITARKIPFLIASGALGSRMKEPDLLLALINSMTATELVTNTKNLEKLGLNSNPVLRGAYDKAVEKASKSKKNTLKTSRAAESVKDEKLKAKLQGLQDRQIAAVGQIEGDWLVLADKSGSMVASLEVASHVSATLSKFVKGKVHLIVFDTMPYYMDVTGKALEDIRKMVNNVRAGGGTSIGCGLQRMLDNKIVVDGIAIVSDGGENGTPFFPQVYPKYAAFAGKEPPVYLYHCDGDDATLKASMHAAAIDMQVFDLNHGIDYYALPNLVQTMRTQRYGLVEEVMATKLLTLDKIFKSERKEATVSA